MNSSTKNIEDVDDDLFMSKKPQDYIFAEKKVMDISERTNRMMLNSKIIVEETQQIGQSTLENLSTQRETLERVENDLDSINTMTRATQKHLNNMKSFFGGIRSIFGSSNNQAASSQPTVPKTKPASIPKSASMSQVAPGPSTTRQALASAEPVSSVRKEPADEFEANLSELGFGLGMLKEMAMKLGDEIGDQNEMLDRITDKSERAGDSVKHQNRQIQQLLKK